MVGQTGLDPGDGGRISVTHFAGIAESLLTHVVHVLEVGFEFFVGFGREHEAFAAVGHHAAEDFGKFGRGVVAEIDGLVEAGLESVVQLHQCFHVALISG